jgi:hypothetical protein
MINTRTNTQLHRPIANLSSYQGSVYHSGVKLFNILPVSIINLKNEKKKTFQDCVEKLFAKLFLLLYTRIYFTSKYPYVISVQVVP